MIHLQAEMLNIRSAIKKSTQVAQSNLTLEAAFNSMEPSPAVKGVFKNALNEFLDDPTFPTLAFFNILQSMKAQKAAEEAEAEALARNQAESKAAQEATKAKADDIEERKNRMIKSIETKVERKRRDIQDKFRKRQ